MGAENRRPVKPFEYDAPSPFDPVEFIESISDPWWKVQLLRVRLVWLRFVEWVRP